jgi:hypothetical protein
VIFWVVVVGVYSNVSEEHSVSVFRVEDGGSVFLRNVALIHEDHTVHQPRISQSVMDLTCVCV